ncbi:LUD domain-containing protein [Halorubellus litoreus]|uniref:LUD domain-containing protein n=1 Tax=Halorubellus litoreus TaxID=755308 RepID=A0ABD5VL03_9EURY
MALTRMSDAFGDFVDAADAVEVDVHRVDAAEFQEYLTELLETPAVGVSLDDAFDADGVELAETPVAVDPTPAALEAATTGVTPAALGVADYGSVVLRTSAAGSELVSLFVEHHVAVVRATDIQPSMRDALSALDDEFAETRGSAIVATGPSATADMGALVRGAHGPRDVDVIVVEGESA